MIRGQDLAGAQSAPLGGGLGACTHQDIFALTLSRARAINESNAAG